MNNMDASEISLDVGSQSQLTQGRLVRVDSTAVAFVCRPTVKYKTL